MEPTSLTCSGMLISWLRENDAALNVCSATAGLSHYFYNLLDIILLSADIKKKLDKF
jgi:hypothetical protein